MDSAKYPRYNETGGQKERETVPAPHFEEGQQRVLTTTKIADEYLQSGWCARCGYKRSQRGNCPNCDHWYTHPLLTIGGTIAACMTLLLFLGIKSVRESDPIFAPRPAPASVLSAPEYIAPAYTNAPPRFFTSVAPGVVSFASEEPPAIEKQASRLEELRETVHAAEREYRRASAQQSVATAPVGRIRLQAEQSAPAIY